MNSIWGSKWCVLIQEHKLHTTYGKCFTYLFPLFELGCCILLGQDHMAHTNRLGENLCFVDTWQGLLSSQEDVSSDPGNKVYRTAHSITTYLRSEGLNVLA